MTPLQIVALVVGLIVSVVGLGGSAFAVGRVILVTEVRVANLMEAMKEVKQKADGTDKDVTGPVRITAANMAKDIASVEDKLDNLSDDFKAFVAEYRADQKGKRS